jgi:hypothetical protein
LDSLAADQEVPKPPPPLPGSRSAHCFVRREPRGLALIIGTW